MKWVARSAKWIIGIAILAVLALSAWHIFYDAQDNERIRLGDGVFTADIADTEAERRQGLGGVHELPGTRAMLLVYDHDDKWGVWMKGMMVNIDIIWLDSNKEVVHIVKNVSPDTYPQTFTPDKPARYVLEVPAGTVDSKNIHVGSPAYFELPHKGV